MPKRKANSSDHLDTPSSRPAISMDYQQNLMISLAMDCAEKQMRDGTASSQVITHFLKLGTEKERLEREILEHQRDHLAAKTAQIESSANSEQMLAEVMLHLDIYTGKEEYEDELY